MCKIAVSWVIVVVVAVSLLLLFNYWVPWQPISALFYFGLALAIGGLACVAIPLRFLGIRKRATGAIILLFGILVAVVALMWPASMVRVSQSKQRLDAVMPEYHFSERHVVRVKASPEQVMTAIRETTFGDIPAFAALMRVRNLASGHLSRPSGRMSERKILEVMSNPRSSFLPLDTESLELVYGMAGRPWSNGRQAAPSTPAEYAAYRAPDSVKIAFNLRVEEAGSGWSELSTETRILALDSSAKRKMGMYWRMIDAGSGMIRRQWVDSIRKRAETIPAPAQS